MNNKDIKANSKYSRRSFLSGMAVAGAGSALGAVRLPDISHSDNIYGAANIENDEDIEISGNNTDNILLKRLVPRPKKVELNDDKEVILDKGLTLQIEIGISDDQTKQKVSDIFRQYFHATPIVHVVQKKDTPPGEAYKIQASGTTLTLSSASFTGIRYALYTLRQLAEANGATEKLVFYSIPEVKIEDAPIISFRGLHLCWFPETEAIQMEQYLRWAAYYKFNHIIIEFWGTYPFISHPALGWEEYSASQADIRKLVALSKDLGITLIPQFNIFGHASGSRRSSGKHVTLDIHPEYQPLFEPDGWVWCLSNPNTRRVLTDAVLETFEAFDSPPYYLVGGDEAWGAAECRTCRHSDYKALMIDHLTYFHKLLGERNCRMMMWHDMLIVKGDPRWKGYVAEGSPLMEGVVDVLPKDIIICDWQYFKKASEDEKWPTMTYFKEKGFTVLACPWNKVDNIKALGEGVTNLGLDGLLCTTWHSPSLREMPEIMMYGAQAAWTSPPYANVDKPMSQRHLRQIGWDIPVKNYKNTGVLEWQVRPDIYP